MSCGHAQKPTSPSRLLTVAHHGFPDGPTASERLLRLRLRQTSGAPPSLSATARERPTEPSDGLGLVQGANLRTVSGVRPERRPVDEAESLLANRADWDAYADEYQSTHGEFLGDAGFLWGPEGVREDQVGALGDVSGRDVLE